MKYGGRNQSASSAHKKRGYFEERIPREKTFGHAKAVFWGCLIASLAFAVFSFYCQYEFNAAVGNDILRSLAIGVGTLICVALLYALIMVCYTKYAFSSAQKALVVVGVLVASFIARFVIAVLTTLESTETGVVSHGDISASFVSALYSAFGGLTFEGMDGELSIAVWQAAVYHGVAILAALVFFSSATLALDYPIASSVTRAIRKMSAHLSSAFCAVGAAMRGNPWRTAYKNGKPDVYIFDSITQDTVLLAEDILANYRNAADERRHGRKSADISAFNFGERKKGGPEDDGTDAQSTPSRCSFAVAERKGFRKTTAAFRCETSDLRAYRKEHRKAADEEKRTYDEDAVAWTMGKSCIIVFCGPECEAYDRKNSLHRRIEANNFLYLRYNFGRDIPIARARNESTAGYGVVRTWLHSARNIHFFAFSRDESFEEKNGRKYRSEQINARSVADELDALTFRIKSAYTRKNRRRLRRLKRRGDGSVKTFKLASERWAARVCFYILSENDIDYSTYQARLVAYSGETAKYTDTLLDLKLVNEAERATWHQSLKANHNLPNKIAETYADEIMEVKKNLPADSDLKERCAGVADGAITESHGKKIVRILSLGFGDTARKTIGSLYINHDGNMVVDAVDRNVDNIIGAYKRTHPSVLCVPAQSGSGIDFGDLHGAIKAGVREGRLDKVPQASEGHKSIFEYDNLLVINYASHDCLGAEVADYIDDCFGGTKVSAVKYDAMIIALGNDDLNITCFRSIIMDIRHELIRKPSTQYLPTTIFVHIGDGKNAARLYWDDSLDKTSYTSFLKDVKVIPYGFKQRVYTYDEIVDDGNALSMNYWYLKKSGYIPMNRASNRYSEWGRADCPSLYKKWSSKVAVTFFQKLCALENGVRQVLEPSKAGSPASSLDSDECEFAVKSLSGAAEHRRWSRFHYVNGYELYGEENSLSISKQVKERNLVHNMLKNFSALTVSQQINNHANGAQAAEWEAEHLVEECLQFPSRNLSETEIEFIVAMLEDDLHEIDGVANGTPNSFMDGLIRALVKCEPANCDNVTGKSDAPSEDATNQWLTQHGLHQKREAVELILKNSDTRYISQLKDLRPKQIEDCIAARNIPAEKGQETVEFRYEMLLRLLASAMKTESDGEKDEQSNEAITNLNEIVANAIPVELVTLLKRGQLSQEFVCKSGDYENFGAAVRMPDGVTITRREELLRLYYIWKKSKKAG